jgi:hypothetical protein
MQISNYFVIAITSRSAVGPANENAKIQMTKDGPLIQSESTVQKQNPRAKCCCQGYFKDTQA